MKITESEFRRVRLVRDFLHLLWDMTVRWYTWDWETAKCSFGFYGEIVNLKFRRLFGLSTRGMIIPDPKRRAKPRSPRTSKRKRHAATNVVTLRDYANP